MKQILLHAVVGNIDVGESIAIVIGKGDAQTVSLLCGNSRALAHVLEGAVAPVVVKNVGRAGKLSRWTIGVKVAAAVLAVLRVPLHVARHEKVQLAIIVVIEKAGRDCPTPAWPACFSCHLAKGSVSVVVIKIVLAVAGDVQVRITLVVVVADGPAHPIVAIASICQTRLLGHVSEGAVSILTVKPVPVA